MQDQSFTYRPSAIGMAVAALTMAGLAVFMAYEALTNQAYVDLFHVVELTPTQGKWFFGLMSVILVAGAVVGVLGLVSGLRAPAVITLSQTAMTAPKSQLGRKLVTVAYADIKSLDYQKIQRQEILKIRHAGGVLSLGLNALGKKQTRADFRAALRARLPSIA